MRQIVITDVTHFNNKGLVCVAGIDINTGECLRPISPNYLSPQDLQKLNIQAGSVLSGEFNFLNNNKPHIEDVSYGDLKFERFCSSEEFREILERTLSNNIEDGFGVVLGNEKKVIVPSLNPQKSLITISVNPENISVFQDTAFGKTRTKIHFSDGSGKEYKYIPVNDLRYYGDNYKEIHFDNKEVFLRIGVGRQYKVNNKDGYWLQVNGIYTFPRTTK
jgi:hypothetical protein